MAGRSATHSAGAAMLVLLAAAAAAVAVLPTAAASAGPSGDVRVARVLEANTLIAGALLSVNMTVRGDLAVGGTLSAKGVKAKKVAADVLETTSLSSPSGTIIVNGELMITNQPAPQKGEAANAASAGNATANAGKASASDAAGQKNRTEAQKNTTQGVATPIVRATSFLAEDVVLGGVRQWKLVRHEDFDQGAEGWSLAEVSSCAGHPADKFMGGHCKAAAAETSKRFEGLPPHSQVRVTARYHFIDNWQGQTAFLKLGERFAWADRHHAPAHPDLGLHMCGSADHAESRMSAPVDVTLPHSASFLEVAFGSTGAAGEDACQRSFGVDDVMLYVR